MGKRSKAIKKEDGRQNKKMKTNRDTTTETEENKDVLLDVQLPTREALSDNKRRFKFPIARIKRIMQRDDDIGKISSFAPVVLGKAVELFLIELMDTVLKRVESGKKKMEIDDLLGVINEDGKFAFLKEYCDETKN